MRIYPQFILWTYVLLPAICLLLSPTIILSIVKAQQQRAKLMANAMNARAKAASALARNQARMQQRNLMQNNRFSNGMSQKPFKFRTTRDAQIPEDGLPVFEDIQNTEVFQRRHWDQQDEALAQLQNMWNMNNFGVTQNEGVLRRRDMDGDQSREWQQIEETVASPRIYDDKEHGSIATTGPFFGRNVYDDVVKQEAPFTSEPISSESFPPERLANPEPTFKKKKKKLQKMPLSLYYPHGTYGAYHPGPYYARTNEDATPFVEQHSQKDNIRDDHQIPGESFPFEKLANPEPTHKKKKKLEKMPPSFYYPQSSYYQSYYQPYSSYYARSNDDVSQFLEPEEHPKDEHDIFGAEDPQQRDLVVPKQNISDNTSDRAEPSQGINNKEIIGVAHFNDPKESWLEAEHLTVNRQDILSSANPDHIHDHPENTGSSDKDHSSIVIIEDITEANINDTTNEHLLPSTPTSRPHDEDMTNVDRFNIPKDSQPINRNLTRNLQHDLNSAEEPESVGDVIINNPNHIDINEKVNVTNDEEELPLPRPRNNEEMMGVAKGNFSEVSRAIDMNLTKLQQDVSSSANLKDDDNNSEALRDQLAPLMSEDVTPKSNNTQTTNHGEDIADVTLVNDSEKPQETQQGGLRSENQGKDHGHSEDVGCELDDDIFEKKPNDYFGMLQGKSASPDPHHHSHGYTHVHSHVHSLQKNFGKNQEVGPNIYGTVYPQTQTHGGIGTSFSHGHASIGLHQAGAQSQVPGQPGAHATAGAGGFGQSSASAHANTQNFNSEIRGFDSGTFGQSAAQANSGSFNGGGFGQSSANAQAATQNFNSGFNSGTFGQSAAQANAQSFNRGGFGQANAQAAAQATQAGPQFFQVLAPSSFVNARENDEPIRQSNEDSFVKSEIRDILHEIERENDRPTRQSVFDGLNLASSIVHSTLDQNPLAHQNGNRKSNDRDTMAFVTDIVDSSLKIDGNSNPNEAKERHNSFHPKTSLSNGNINEATVQGISSISDIVSGNFRNRRQVNQGAAHDNNNLDDIDVVGSNNDNKDLAMVKGNSNEIPSDLDETETITGKSTKQYKKPANIEDEMIEMANPDDRITTEPLTTESFITFKEELNETFLEEATKVNDAGAGVSIDAPPHNSTEHDSLSEPKNILNLSSQSETIKGQENNANPTAFLVPMEDANTELQRTEKSSSNASAAPNIENSREDAKSKSEESSEEHFSNMEGTTEKASMTTFSIVEDNRSTKPVDIDEKANDNITEKEIPLKPILANDERGKEPEGITEGNFNKTEEGEVSTLTPDQIEDIQFTIPDNETSIINSTAVNNNTNENLAKPVLNTGEHGDDDKDEPILGMSLDTNVGKETNSRQNTSKIAFNPSGAPFDSIEAEMSVLTDEEKDAFIRQEIELITEVIEETLKQDIQLKDIMNENNKTEESKPGPAKTSIVSSPHLFQVFDRSTGPENYQRYARSASPTGTFDSILGAHKERLDSIQKEATDDGDLLMITDRYYNRDKIGFIGDSVIKDLENRRGKVENQSAETFETTSVKRTKRKITGFNPERVPITRLVSDPTTKINVPKTLENVGSVLRHTFENPRAPMYHVRSMLGNTRNTLMSAANVPPNNFLVPSQYEIAPLTGHTDGNRRLGEINDKMLFSRSGTDKLKEEPESTKKDSLGIVDTFQKIGGMVKESVQNGKKVVEHANDAATDARNVLYSAKHAAPRLIVPGQIPTLNARSSSDAGASMLGKKAVLITPRVLDVEENMVGAEEEPPEQMFIGMGKIFDAVGLTQPNQPEVDLEKIVLEPAVVDVMKQWEMPKELRSSSIVKTWVKDNFKKDKNNVKETLDSLRNAEQSVGTKNLKEFFSKMHQEMKEILTSQHEERKRRRNEKTKKPKKNPTNSQARNKDRKPSLKKPIRKTVVPIDKPVQKSDATVGAINYDRIIDENTDTTLPPEILQIFLDNPHYKSSSQKNASINSNIMNNPDMASSEDEKLGLNLPPELMKPFMGQPSQDVLDNFMRENDSDFEKLIVYPMSPLNRNVTIAKSGPLMVGEQMPEQFESSLNDTENSVYEKHFIGQGAVAATANPSSPPLVGKPVASSNFNYDNGGSIWTPQQSKATAEATNGQIRTRYSDKTKDSHHREDLGHVLGAMNPMMFERFYNESLSVTDTGPIKSKTQETRNNKADIVASASETLNETRTSEFSELPDKSVKPDITNDQTFFPRLKLELEDVKNADDQLANVRNETETNFVDSTVRTSLKIIPQYKKPFMGRIKHDRIHEYLNQYNNNLSESDEEPINTVEGPVEAQDYAAPIKNIVFSNEDDDYNNNFII